MARTLEGLIGATCFMAGSIVVYGLADLIDGGADVKEYRAFVSVAGGPYEPAGDWTDDKDAAIEDGSCAVSQWGKTRTDCYIEEREEEFAQ